jgi:Nif-specific regulatory protein
LFLDEIGEFSPDVQVKLLRFLQEREYQPVGGNETRRSDARIIVATHRDLRADIAAGLFREDLFYRINVFPIHLPPLRERQMDIIPLATFFLRRFAGPMGKRVDGISPSVLCTLQTYDWPGNVRELEHWMEHAVLTASDGTIRAHNLPPSARPGDGEHAAEGGSLKQSLQLVERQIILSTLDRHGGRIAAAAKELGITSRMLNIKIRQWRLSIKRPPRRRKAR